MGEWWTLPRLSHGAGGHIISEGLSPLRGDQGGRESYRGGDVCELASIVAVADPYGLAIGETGGGREAHRVRLN